MSKKLSALLTVLLVTIFTLSAQQSLLSYSTNRLFTNQNDWASYPSSRFNTVENNLVFAQGDYGRINMNGKNGGGVLLGYHARTKFPFSLAGSFNMNGVGTVEDNFFSDYYASFRSVIGFPEFNNSSVGLFFDYRGINEEEDQEDAYYVDFYIPSFIEIGGVSNYNELHLEVDKLSSNKEYLFCMFDRVTFKSLIPGGESSSAWIAIGTDPFNLDQAEIPAFGSYLDRFTSFQLGLSNRISYTSNSINLVINPKLYTDYLSVGKGAYYLGATLASDVGIQIYNPSSLIGFNFGFTPRFVFFYNTVENSDPTFYVNTNIIWTGNFDLTFYLPRGFHLDVALTVDRKGIPARLAVQCTWAF